MSYGLVLFKSLLANCLVKTSAHSYYSQQHGPDQLIRFAVKLLRGFLLPVFWSLWPVIANQPLLSFKLTFSLNKLPKSR